MQEYSSKKQERRLWKLWVQFSDGNLTTIEELSRYYMPKLTAIAFKHLKDISAARRIAGEVFCNQLSKPSQNTKSISKRMMEAVRQKSLTYLKEVEENPPGWYEMSWKWALSQNSLNLIIKKWKAKTLN